MPFVLPTVVVGSAFLALLGPRSPLGIRLDGSDLGHPRWPTSSTTSRSCCASWAACGRTSTRGWRRRRACSAPRRWRAFREVTLPLLRPAIAVGGLDRLPLHVHLVRRRPAARRPGHATLEVEIYRQTAQLLDLPAAAALTILQMVGVAGAAPRLRAARRSASPSAPARVPRRGSRAARHADAASASSVASSWRRAALLRWACRSLVLVERSLAGGDGLRPGRLRRRSSSPARVAALFVPPSRGHRRLARLRRDRDADLPAARPAGGGGHRLPARLAAHARFDALLMLPLGTSAVIVGFGFLVALDDAAARPAHVRLRSSRSPTPSSRCPSWCVPWCRVIRSIDRRLREAAAVLGASPARAWREVDGPLIAPRRAGRRRLRLRRLAGRVRRHAVHRAARHADDPGRDLPPPRPAGRRQLRAAMAMRRSCYGAHGGCRCSSSSASGGGAGQF